jgi:hypothetical protein
VEDRGVATAKGGSREGRIFMHFRHVLW